MKTSFFDYNLPKKFIAQSPVSPRDSSKLMVYNTSTGEVLHKKFKNIGEFLGPKDVFVLNRSKVIPARILFKRDGKEREIFLLKQLGDDSFEVLVRPGKVFKKGLKIQINKELLCEVTNVLEESRTVRFFTSKKSDLNKILEKCGSVPLPPYIKNKKVDAKSYQTVYAKEKGSVAAPTAGLHFTRSLIEKLKKKGVCFEEIILHVGRGTFSPVKTENIEEHKMHFEDFEISSETAKRLNFHKMHGKRIIAVGTTTVRVLESSFNGKFSGKIGSTNIFIYPGKHNWKAADCLITNFHLPKSTLIMLVASFLEHKGIKNPVQKVLELYELAKSKNYRFYSFGDAMFLL